MIMETKPTRHYGIWMAATLMVVLAAIYVGALVMLVRSEKALAMQAAELAGEVRREGSMHALIGLLKDLSQDTARINAFFVSPDRAISVIEDIEALSSVVGVTIAVADVRIQDQNTATGEGMLSMNVAASGSWRSMAHLLLLLDALPFQSELDSVTLTLVSADEGDASAQWSLRGLLHVPLRQ